MITSNYLNIVIAIILLYPFYLVIAEIIIFQEEHRQIHLKISIIVALIIVLTFTYLHLQTEHIYGQELLEQWHAQNQS